MQEVLNAILSVSSGTTYLVAGLTIASTVVFFQMTQSRLLTLLFLPVATLGALVGIYVSRELGLYYSTDEDSNIIMSSLLGVLLSLTIVMMTARLTYMFINFIRKSQSKRLRRTRADAVDKP